MDHFGGLGMWCLGLGTFYGLALMQHLDLTKNPKERNMWFKALLKHPEMPKTCILLGSLRPLLELLTGS